MRNKSGFRVVASAAMAMMFLLACGVRPLTGGGAARGTGGINALQQQAKPYLIIVSIDGFRWDYMDRYPTPNMDRIAAAGSRAEHLIPVFPTLTFPNHYSIATGLYPAHHGLVANDFPDPARNKWYSLKDRETVEDRWFYAGEPIWVTAETQGMVAASFFFVGSEAPINGVYPTHWRSYDKNITGRQRVDQVLTWLAEPAEKRPHLYTLYFEDVDDYSHWYGTDSAENIEAIRRVDAYLGRLLRGLEKLPYAEQVNIILVSDHGQSDYLQNQQPFILGDYVRLKDTTIVEGGSYLFLYFDQNEPGRARNVVATVNSRWEHGRAYTPADTPRQWYVDSNPRFPDVILMPETGFAVLSSMEKVDKIGAGDHGWAPESPAMHGFFVASGPNIKPGISLDPISSIDIYPLMLSILGLEAPAMVDGDAGKLAKILEPDEG